MRECSDEVRLGMTSEVSTWSLVPGLSRVAGRTKWEWSLKDGPILTVLDQLRKALKGGRRGQDFSERQAPAARKFVQEALNECQGLSRGG
jgi:hypothetical protein